MARNYKPGDPILLGLQANQVSWSEHYSNWIYGRGGDNFGPDPTRSYKKILYIIKGNLHKVWSIII